MSSAGRSKALLRQSKKLLGKRSLTNTQAVKSLTAVPAALDTSCATPPPPPPAVDSPVQLAEKTLLDLDGPKGWPVIGNFATYLKKKNIGRIHEVQAELHSKYGPIFREQWGPKDQLHVCDPDVIERIMRSQERYPDRPPIQAWRLYRKLTGLPTGIVTADLRLRNTLSKRILQPRHVSHYTGELARITDAKLFSNNTSFEKDEWLHLRNTLSKRILQPRHVSHYTGELARITDDLIAHVRRVRDTEGDQHLADRLPNEAYRWSMECVGDILFDRRLGCLEPEIPERVQEFINNINLMLRSSVALIVGESLHCKLNTPIWKKHQKAWDGIFRIGKSYIDEKMEEIRQREEARQSRDVTKVTDPSAPSDPEHTDLLTFMLAKLSPAQVNVNVTEILLSGIDTTSNSLCFSLYLLAKHPEVQERLATEVRHVLGNRSTPAYEDFEEMPYLRAVLKESLRMFPVVTMNVRVLDSDVTVKGYRIPEGTLCVMNNYAACRDDAYFERANEFLPERWLRESGTGLKHHPFAALPFGYGTRSCIGKRIAHLELQLALAKISQNFWVAPSGDGELKPFLRTLLTPGNTVPIRFMDR